MDEHLSVNRAHWDEATDVHIASDFYDVASFKAGGTFYMPMMFSIKARKP